MSLIEKAGQFDVLVDKLEKSAQSAGGHGAGHFTKLLDPKEQKIKEIKGRLKNLHLLAVQYRGEKQDLEAALQKLTGGDVGDLEMRAEKLPISVQKTQDVAARFEEKLNKLAQVQTFPGPSGQGINAPYVPGTEPAVQQPAAEKADPSVTGLKQMNAPAVKEQGKPQVKVDPELKEVQKFLNQSMPYNNIKEDGIWGPETSGLLVAWAKLNKLPTDVQSALAAAKARALANSAVKNIKPGPELGQAQHTASVKSNLISLADKFDTKYAR